MITYWSEFFWIVCPSPHCSSTVRHRQDDHRPFNTVASVLRQSCAQHPSVRPPSHRLRAPVSTAVAPRLRYAIPPPTRFVSRASPSSANCHKAPTRPFFLEQVSKQHSQECLLRRLPLSGLRTKSASAEEVTRSPYPLCGHGIL